MAIDPRAFKKHNPLPESRKKKCSGCGEEKNFPDDFYLQKKRARKRDSKCKVCKAEAYKRWVKTPEGRAARLASQMKYLATPRGKAAKERMIAKRQKEAEARRRERKASKKEPA